MTSSRLRPLAGLCLSLVVTGCANPGGGSADASLGAPDAGAADPTLAIDQHPFGHHPALAFGIAGDPYAPARETGLAWTRGGDAPYLFWSLVDPSRTGDPAKMKFAGTATGPTGQPATFDFDKGIGAAAASGLEVMWNIVVEPRPGSFSKPGSWLPIDEAAYARFVETAVKRYLAVRVWQVGNEPNLEEKLQGARADFAKLQKLTYEAIKRANPDAVVAMGGIAGNMSTKDQDDTYFDAVLDELDGGSVDVFDIHFYGDSRGGLTSSGPGERLLGYQDFEDVAHFYRTHLDARGYASTRIWTTENGTPSGTWRFGPSTLSATEAEQARDLPKRTVVALASGVDKLFWAWGMTEGFGPWDDDFFDHTGLLYGGHGAPAGTKKLAYWALWQMTRQMDGCDWRKIERLSTTVPETRAYRCPRQGGGAIVAAWWDTFRVTGYRDGQTVQLAVPWTSPTAVVHPAVPAGASGAAVDPAAAFLTSSLTPSDGRVTLTLGADPVYLRAD
ncbi:MAG: cellulase family glycosylhydrolase [Myxococcaceae bacterium]